MKYFHRFRVGSIQCIALYDNSRQMPVEQCFPNVPGANLRQALEANGFDPAVVTVGYNCLYVNTGERQVLVDTGSGEGNLQANLRSAGVEPGEIDTIIITHGDGDHIGGIGDFPSARIVMTPLAWELWTTSDGQARMVEEFIALFRGQAPDEQLAEMAARRGAYGTQLLPGLAPRIDLVEPETEFIPGIRLIAAPGHRSDHTAVLVESAGESLIHMVDGIRHPLQVANPDWTSYIDSYPEQMVATNRKLLGRVAPSNSLLFAAHLPFPGLLRLGAKDNVWSWSLL